MAPPRRNINGRSPLVNQQRQITSFFTKSTSSPSPSPILSISSSNLNPNPNPNPSDSPHTPSQPHRPLLLIGASPSPSPPSTDVVVGRRVKVYWPLDKAWYEGSVKSFDKITSKHLVRYDDGEEEALDLSKEKIEWPHLRHQHCEGRKKLKRLRKMVIEDDNVEEIHKLDDELVVDDDDDSSDEDWGKNVVVEDDDDGECEEDMELEEEEEDVAKRSKRKKSEKLEARKRKVGGTEKLEPLKKSKSAGEVQVNNGGFKLSALEPNNISNLESK